MFFISPWLLNRSGQCFNHPHPQNKPSDLTIPNERTLMASADQHHFVAVNDLQKAKRVYFLERAPFL